MGKWDEAAAFLGLPEDTVRGFPRIQAAGNLRLRLENHRGVERMTEEEIAFGTARGQVRILGEGLTLSLLDRDEAVIAGRIRQVDLTDLS